MGTKLKLEIIKHYGGNFIKESVHMQISYELDYRDIARFILYRNLGSADVKRRKTVLQQMIAIVLLANIPAFQLKHPAVIPLALVICFLWLASCNMFMNHILLKQMLEEYKEITYERIEIVSAKKLLLIHTGRKQYFYPYEEVTHFLYLKRPLLLTLYDRSSILTPRRAFNSNHDYKAFYMHILNHCPQW